MSVSSLMSSGRGAFLWYFVDKIENSCAEYALDWGWPVSDFVCAVVADRHELTHGKATRARQGLGDVKGPTCYYLVAVCRDAASIP